MSKETQTAAEGALVVDSDGTTSWWLPRVAAVAEVRLPVADGVELAVDAADPTLVLAWAAAPGAEIESLAGVFADAGLVDRVRALRGGGEQVVVENAPTLTRPWVRMATVAAVRQCAVLPLHEGALLLDLASATSGVGHAEAAAHVFGLAAPVLLALGEQCLAREIRGGAATELVEIAQVADAALAGTAWADDVHALAARLREEVSEIPDVFAFDFAGAVRADIDGPSVLMPVAVKTLEFVDPTLVPARILAWRGAAERELIIEVHDDHVVVSASLADGIDDRTLEANQLLAYAARLEDGGLIASSPMTVHDHTVSAALPIVGGDQAVSFGIIHADGDFDDVRVDAVGRDLLRVDRQMVDAFGDQRAAVAELHRTSLLDDQTEALDASTRYIRAAKAAAGDALTRLEERLDASIDDVDVRELIEARVAAVEAFEIRVERRAVSAGTEPLLAELVSRSGAE
ncbi:hypothetical protein [Mycolicibacterium hippocampi]|uniref:Uncharacterized protein n=1 Tax=Mycolicibacterium hippocampi TaxID=659824 RepID=A0A850PNA0_9MYCO|nr:hypothetical protein [Mycolicibacterium hippocampi]NVN49156.1 hypothetical protein [Mycolicibacterium hippocampi]